MAYIDLFYGLGKIGAILAPLNWRLVAPELAYIVNDNQPKVLICGPEFVDTLAEMRPKIDVAHYVGLEGAEIEGALSYEDELAQASDAEPERPPLEADDTYAILYTSGITGRPKGAMIPHRQILWNAINTIVSWGPNENDVSPVFTPLFHAGGLFAFMTPLFYVGGRIVLFRTFELDAILKAIVDEKCTVVLGVPTIFRMIMNHPGFADADFSQVRFFISGGAPLPVELVQDWLKAKGGVFRQGYGLTEVGVNCFSMTDEESVWKLGSVGKPIFHFGGPRHIPVTSEALAVLTDMEADPIERLRRGIAISTAPGFAEANPDIIEAWLAYRVQNPILPARYQAQMAIGLALMCEEACFEHQLKNIQSPTLILFGEHDKVVPPGNADLLAKEIPHSMVKILPNAGHFFPMEVPDEAIAVIVEFLKA